MTDRNQIFLPVSTCGVLPLHLQDSKGQHLLALITLPPKCHNNECKSVSQT